MVRITNEVRIKRRGEESPCASDSWFLNEVANRMQLFLQIDYTNIQYYIYLDVSGLFYYNKPLKPKLWAVELEHWHSLAQSNLKMSAYNKGGDRFPKVNRYKR